VSLPAPRPARLEAVRFGRLAEMLCAMRLTLLGYRILARGYRVPVGEIDIVARRRDTLVFVEVKARAVLEDALAAVAPRQRQRVMRAAEAYVATHPQLALLTTRFDVMIVLPWPHLRCLWPLHLRDAWRPGLA